MVCKVRYCLSLKVLKECQLRARSIQLTRCRPTFCLRTTTGNTDTATASIPGIRQPPIQNSAHQSMPYLPPPKSLVKRVKGKCLSSTLRAFKDKLQTETASKQFSQVHYGDPHHRGHEKLPGVGSPAPTEDHMTTRTSYMPLFSERLNLCKPKVNSIKWEPNTTSLLNKGKHTGQSSCLKASSRSTYDNRTQNSQM
uniref:uncharacterized protein LOC118529163 isoform X3 n=1 Tax=Halichoerus grypus TaxID=9711 RepID=UPI001658DD30|nr:uncharacterized protein LOC118529163 isoform X3 [Halichoerus grypus]